MARDTSEGAATGAVEGVYLSETLHLPDFFADAFLPHAHRIRVRLPHEIKDRSTVRFALAWQPASDAFRPYPNVDLVCSIGAGVDSLMTCPSLPPQAIVTRVRDDNQAHLMAGFAVWHLIWHHRNMRAIMADVAAGAWNWRGHPLRLAPPSCPVGVLGYGLMGRAVARAVAALGFPVFAANRTQPEDAHDGITVLSGPDAIEAVAKRVTTLINVLPLTADTHGILDARLFATMPQGTVLIQLGRGAHLVEADLAAALESGQISAASLDVFNTEPLPPQHPWWKDPRILITPHLASNTSPEFVALQVADSVADVMAGRLPVNAVSRTAGY